MIDLIFSCLTNAIYIITGSVLFVYLTSRILPSCLLNPKYKVAPQKATVVNNHTNEGCELTAYTPEQDIQKYIPQYILLENKGERFLKCKFNSSIASIKYAVTAFDRNGKEIDTIDVFDSPNNTEFANTVCLPFSTDSISLYVYKVNGKSIPQSNISRHSFLLYALYFVLNFAVTAAFSLFSSYVIVNVIKDFSDFDQTIFGDGIKFRMLFALAISTFYSLIAINKSLKSK